jgi:hypothetical protein
VVFAVVFAVDVVTVIVVVVVFVDVVVVLVLAVDVGLETPELILVVLAPDVVWELDEELGVDVDVDMLLVVEVVAVAFHGTGTLGTG